MNRPPAPAARPWYREPWPWLLMAGPFVVVVAGIATAWIAVRTDDGLVHEDYYRKGLAASQTLARSARAREVGLVASIRLATDGIDVRLSAPGTDFSPPARLVLTLSHPTRAGLDRAVLLEPRVETYASAAAAPASGHWLVMLEDEAQSWRLLGNVVLPAPARFTLGGEPAAAAASQR